MAKSKYRAKPVVIDNIRFASQKEGKRYGELKLLERAGQIHGLQLQPTFHLTVPSVGTGGPYERANVGQYRADFSYCECRNQVKCEIGPRPRAFVVEDVKGFKTPLYRWKKKHFEAQYNITIREI